MTGSKMVRMRKLYFDEQKIKYTDGDYIRSVAELHAGVMEIQGARPTQEDKMVLAEIAHFHLLDKKEREQVLEATFKQMQKNNEMAKAGSTACVVLAKAESGLVRVNFGAIGDSEGYFVIKNKKGVTVTRLNALHTPNCAKEIARLKETKREIFEGRINGLALTRAIGDEGILSEKSDHTPQIDENIFKVSENDEAFILVACDGLFERKGEQYQMTDADKEKFIGDSILIGESPFYMVLRLVGDAFRCGSKDNISAAVLQIKLGVKTVMAAIFDGHGGKMVSKNLAKTFLPTLQKYIKEKITDKKKQFLIDLDKELITASKIDILNKFEELRKPDGLYAFTLVSRNPLFDKFRLLFKCNANNGEKNFFQTRTYELTIKKLQEKYVALGGKVDEKFLKKEQRFIDYVTGNGVLHFCETTARKKMQLTESA